MQDVLTVCCYCGCGCGLYLHVENGKVVGSMPSRSHPVTKGNLCAKGWHVHDYIHDPARLTTPLVRKKGKLVPCSWDEALETTAAALVRIKEEYGPNSLGMLASAKCTNEENYLMQKFARAVLGTNNIDHCARL
jgi:predicted molibdopterin-dependent oxidoreductase YjgC